VTSTLLGAPRLPDWYLGVQYWADGLSTAYFALLAPAAMRCIAAAILRTRVLPRWTGYVFLAATVLLLGQYAAFRGALPFPQFSRSSPSASRRWPTGRRQHCHRRSSWAYRARTGSQHVTTPEAQMTSHPNFDRTQAALNAAGKVTMHPLSTPSPTMS